MGTHAPELTRPEIVVAPESRVIDHRRIWTRPPVAGITALTVLGAAARFIGLGRQSFWLDEAATVHIMRMHFGQMFAWLPHHEATPPLYFVLAWLWTHVFGLSPIGLRSLSALFGALTVPVAWAAGRRLAGGRVGLAVAALAACNPLLIWYSQEARAYALLVLLTSVALLAWLHLRDAPSARWAAVWGLASALAFATHWYAVLVIAPEAVWLLRRQSHHRTVRLALFGMLLTVLCLLPLMRAQLYGVGDATWLNQIPLGWRLGRVPRNFAIGPDAVAATWLLTGTGLAVAIAIWLAVHRISPTARRSLRPVAGLLLGSLMIVAALLLTSSDQVSYRYLLALWLPAALIVAGGLAGPGAGRPGAVVLAALCAVGLVAATSVLLDARYQRPDWKAVATAVGTVQTPPLYLVAGCSASPLDIYLRGLAQTPVRDVATARLDLVSANGQSSMAAVAWSHWAETCGPVRHDFVAPYRLGPFVRTGPPVRIGNLRVWRLRAPRPVRLTGALFRGAGMSGDLLTRSRSTGGA
jgi:mannosyltransferase